MILHRLKFSSCATTDALLPPLIDFVSKLAKVVFANK